jgi:hypothetical protein
MTRWSVLRKSRQFSPIVAELATMALMKASRVRMSEGLRSAATISTI